MDKEFVTHEIAEKLKELGFNKQCFAGYFQYDGSRPWLEIYQDNNEEDTQNKTKECQAQLWQQVIDWFRIEHNFHILIFEQLRPKNDFVYGYKLNSNAENITDGFKTYEEAREQGILKALELIKK